MDCHSGPDTAPEYRAGTVLTMDLLGEKRRGKTTLTNGPVAIST